MLPADVATDGPDDASVVSPAVSTVTVSPGLAIGGPRLHQRQRPALTGIRLGAGDRGIGRAHRQGVTDQRSRVTNTRQRRHVVRRRTHRIRLTDRARLAREHRHRRTRGRVTSRRRHRHPDVASVGKPELATVTVSPGLLFGAHTFTTVNVAACGVFVSVQVIDAPTSAAAIVKVLPLNGTELPVQARVAA